MSHQSLYGVYSAVIAVMAVFFAGTSAEARAPEVYMQSGGFFGKAWEYAINGYDAVAYYALEEGADPVEGNDAFVATYKGEKWRFSNQENLDAFEADPAQYAPQYGGYCAWAVAENKLAKGDPAQWHVHEGKLYLNVNARIKRSWLSDIEGYLARSEMNWPGILDRN